MRNAWLSLGGRASEWRWLVLPLGAGKGPGVENIDGLVVVWSWCDVLIRASTTSAACSVGLSDLLPAFFDGVATERRQRTVVTLICSLPSVFPHSFLRGQCTCVDVRLAPMRQQRHRIRNYRFVAVWNRR